MPGLDQPGVQEFLLRGTPGSARVDELAPAHRKMLTLGHKWLGVYLPHVLQKVDR